MAKKLNTARSLALKVMHEKIFQAIGRLETGNTGARPIIFSNKDVVVYAVAERTAAGLTDQDNQTLKRKCEDRKEKAAAPAGGGLVQGLFQVDG